MGRRLLAAFIAAATLLVCLLPNSAIAQQQQPDSREVKKLKVIERHLGTTAAGVFVILVGLIGIAKATRIIRPVFRGDRIWYKVGVVALILAGLFMVLLGVEIAKQGAQGKSLDKWLSEG